MNTICTIKYIATLLLLTAVHATLHAQMTSNDTLLRKLHMAEICINNLYVEEVDEKKLVEDAIKGMLEKLDPHSSYLDAKEVKASNETLQGSFEGIGIQFNMVEDTLMVIQPVTNGPSEKVGIIAGDRIITVNDSTIAGVKKSREEIMRCLRGPKGSKVKLGIKRQDIDELLTFTVTRDKIPVKTVDAHYMVEPGIGYIRIGSFGSTTHQEFMECLEQLQQQGMSKLLLDLQDNGGGYLQAAGEVAEEFLENNALLVYTKGRRVPERHYRAKDNGHFTQGNVVVMVDEYTASAAEIVTGAIQDHDRGDVVGRRTYGKGLVQVPVSLPYKATLKLTTSKYYIPSGRCIQAINYKHTGGGYTERIADSLTHVFYTRNGREVRDGGGIKPDVEVRPDTLPNIALYMERIDSTEVMHNFVIDYIASHPTIAPPREFSLTDEDFEALKQRAIKGGFTYDQITEKKVNELIELAKFEGYYEDAKELFDQLKAKLKHNIATDMDRHKQIIKQMVEADIIPAYYYQRGAIEASIMQDKTVKEALRILKDEKGYTQRLRAVK